MIDVTVPVRAPHTFNNPTGEEAKFFNTFSPAFYINYFKILAKFIAEDKMTEEVGLKAMATFATLPAKLT